MSGTQELKKFEIHGEVGFWVRALNRRAGEELAQRVIDKILDGRLFKDDDVYNPWAEVKRMDEVQE